MSSSSLNVLTLGASRGIGYHAATRLLDQGATVTFLLRSTAIFDDDSTIQKYVKSGRARLIKGDGLIEADTKRAWDAAGVVDAVICTVGSLPTGFSLTKGFTIKPHNLVTQCVLNLLCSMPTYTDAPQPKFVFFSSTGVTPASHAGLALSLKLLYFFIHVPHMDKVGMERVVSHCAGWSWDPKADGKVPIDIFGEGWTERRGLPAPGTLKHVLRIRGGLLNDGECLADTKGSAAYKVTEGDKNYGYSISRKDAAHFIVDAITRRWDEFDNKRVNLTY